MLGSFRRKKVDKERVDKNPAIFILDTKEDAADNKKKWRIIQHLMVSVRPMIDVLDRLIITLLRAAGWWGLMIEDSTFSLRTKVRKHSRLMSLFGTVALVAFLVWFCTIIFMLKEIRPDAYGGVSVTHPYFLFNKGKIQQKKLIGDEHGSYESAILEAVCERLTIEAVNDGVFEQKTWKVGGTNDKSNKSGGLEKAGGVTMYMMTNVFDALREMSIVSKQRIAIPKMINFTHSECIYGIHEGHIPRIPQHGEYAAGAERDVELAGKGSEYQMERPPFAPNMCAMYVSLSSGEEFLMVNPIIATASDTKKTVVMTDPRFNSGGIVKQYPDRISVFFTDWSTKTSKSIFISGSDSYIFQVEYDLLMSGTTIYDTDKKKG